MRPFQWMVALAFAAEWACAHPVPTMALPAPHPISQARPPIAAPSLFPELSGDQAWAAFRAGVLFLDARQGTDFWQGHIPGALNLPVWAKDFESRLLDFLTGPKGDPGTAVVVYCGGCCSTDSLMLARRLRDFGFQRIQIYRDGYPGWARADKPIERAAGTAEVNLVLDGCPIACGRKAFDRLSLPCQPVVLTDFGIEKGGTPITEDLIAQTAERLRALLPAGSPVLEC